MCRQLGFPIDQVGQEVLERLPGCRRRHGGERVEDLLGLSWIESTDGDVHVNQNPVAHERRRFEE